MPNGLPFGGLNIMAETKNVTAIKKMHRLWRNERKA